jgi:predicted phage tail protein
LNWSTPTDGGSPILGYNVYRSTSSGIETLLTTVGVASTYTDSAVVNGTTYWYQVSAFNAAGEGPRSAESSTTPTAPLTVPSAPANLSATPDSRKGVDLVWLAPTSDGGSAVTGYQIWRGTSSGSETLLTTVGSVTSFRDAGTKKNTRYYYVVRAVNAIGTGPASIEATAIAR